MCIIQPVEMAETRISPLGGITGWKRRHHSTAYPWFPIIDQYLLAFSLKPVSSY
jgi:hypothetical protein